MLPDWQRAYGGPVLSCQLRKDNADFQVMERLGFELSEDGEHDYLQIEKDGANTTWVAQGLAGFAGVNQADVGFAGMKDRHAVTTQWYSVRRPAGGKTDWKNLELDGVRIQLQSRHRRKLRRGGHTGNQFCIAMRNLVETESGLTERLEKIRDAGVPNYFGEQRFGHDGGNLDLARDLFTGRRLSRGKRSIAMSAARSFLFNQILHTRVADGSWATLLPGDCAKLEGSGSFFPVDAVDADLEHRLAALDIHASGALWGTGAPQSSGDIAELENTIAARFADLADGLKNERARHGRRALRLAVRDLGWERDGDTLWLRFFLVRGGFATAVLREVATY